MCLTTTMWSSRSSDCGAVARRERTGEALPREPSREGLEARPEPLVTPRLQQTAALRRGGEAGEDGRGEGEADGRGEGEADGRGEGEEEGSAPQSLDLLDQIVVVRHMLTPAPATPKLLHDIVGARGNPLRARGP